MSALFDDWAYQSVYEPVSPAQGARGSFSKEKRARAASIVQAVAHAPSVPEPEVRARAATVGSDSDLQRGRSESQLKPDVPVDVPLTKIEYKSHWDREAWLGSLSPSVHSFDRHLWEEKVAPYIVARDEARLTGKIVANARGSAAELAGEVGWLVHELRDTREHDLDPLRTELVRKHELEERRAKAEAVRECLATVWDAQDRISRDLRKPAPKVVPHLNGILADIDKGLLVCEKHPDFIGIDLAASVLRNCAQRALAIACAYATHELTKIANKISGRAAESTAGTRQALIVTKFADDAARLRPMAAMLRSHTDSSPQTNRFGMQSYWDELQSKYFGIRGALIQKDVDIAVQPLDPFTQLNDIFIDTARTSLVQFQQIYSSEKKVFESLFGPATAELWSWLYDEVSDPLLVAVRRVIVRETDIAKLGQLIVLVHSEVEPSTDAPDLGDSQDYGIYSSDATDSVVADRSLLGGSLLGGSMLNGSLASRSITTRSSVHRPGSVSIANGGGGSTTAATRAARAAAVAQSSRASGSVTTVTDSFRVSQSNDSAFGASVGLNGSTEDPAAGSSSALHGPATPLDPRELIYRDAQNRIVFRANLEVDSFAKYKPLSKDLQRAVYPLVDRALNLLGQVYQLLNARVFNELAHRCVRECLASLEHAVANSIAAASSEDAVRIHLFHIKQLLVLQSHIVDFDLQSTLIQEVDFSGIQRLLSRDSRKEARSFRDLITLAWDSVPQVVEIMFDAMEELYASLRRAVNRMCASFVEVVSQPLAEDATGGFRDYLVKEFRRLLTAIAEYTTDGEVTRFLVDSAQEAVVDKYTLFYRGLPAEALDNESLMDIDTMASWLSATIAELSTTPELQD